MNKSISNYIWSAAQKFSVIFVQFVSNLILARLITPEEFGYVGLLAVLINILQAFVDGGFGSSIIHKQNLTEIDKSTVFFYNLSFAGVAYLLLFISSPTIAAYFNLTDLRQFIRVEGIILIINACCIIQLNMLIRELDFRKIFIANFTSVVIGMIVAVYMAIKGFGVWSIIGRDLVKESVLLLLLLFQSKWVPKVVFDWDAFKHLFRYGFPILLASIVRRVYDNIQAMVIGRNFTARDLGYYTQAKKLEEVPTYAFSESVGQVIFPSFSKYVNDITKVKNQLRMSISLAIFIFAPIVAILYICSDSLFIVLFSDKWLDSVPMFKILCAAAVFTPLINISCETYKAIGRSDTFFYVQLSQRIIGSIIIILSVFGGLSMVLYSLVFNNILFYCINLFFNKRYLGYSYIQQIKDAFPPIISCIGILAIGQLLKCNTICSESPIANIAIMVILIILAYIIVTFALRLPQYNVIKSKFYEFKRHY